MPFDVSLNDFGRMQMIQSIENLFGDKIDPFFFQTIAFRRFNQISDRTSTTIFHHQLQHIHGFIPFLSRSPIVDRVHFCRKEIS